MNKNKQMVSRRNFIKVSSLTAGGLLIGFNFSCKDHTKQKSTLGELYRFNAYLSINTNGLVEIFNPVPEIGQGVKTALPMLVAEELDIAWKNIIVKQADANEAYGGYEQSAAGSNSVRYYWEPMRKAGAVARELLLQAAADQWQLDKTICYMHNGIVKNHNNNKELTIGELAQPASTYPIPVNIPLKNPNEFKIIGKTVSNPDIEKILSGTAVFGQDVRIPDMLYASMEKSSTYGATVKSFDTSDALKIPGVQYVFKVPFHGNSERPFCREGVSVVGDSVWAVLQGRKALKIVWDLGENTKEGTDHLHESGRRLIEKKGKELVKNDGNTYKALISSKNTMEAIYHVPFIAHIPMETVNCTIDLKSDRCEIWSTTQVPFADLNFLSGFFELPTEKIKLHVTRIGGGFGRRLGPDFTIEAAKIAKELKRPIQYFWTREDDIRYDSYRPFSYHKLEAAWDDNLKITSWLHRQSGTSRYAFRPNVKPYQSEFFPNNFPANLIPNFRQEYSLIESNINRSLIRAPGNNALAFVVESFMDELAHSTGQDPLSFRLDMLGMEDKEYYFEENSVISTKRMKKVLKLAAEQAEWGKQVPPGRGLGIAGYFTFDTYVAHVADVSVDSLGNLTIHKFTSAVDCGQVLNKDGVSAQVEGAIMDGLSATLYQEITIAGGKTNQSNFDDYRILRMAQSPHDIEVHIVENHHPPTGMGEPPYPPVAPALCNAIFAACGKRIRILPIGDQLKIK
ncbi:MAG: xanthine dehydrogenase family protein molybdopterin-binding subunit [Flavobacteriaceae bacterium]|nr:xanthine dehydrogenase family protein molybdopterin-binding subunit [Flavobacteriaceae bacterium]